MLNIYLLVAALRIGSNEGKTRQMVAFGEQILFRLLFHPPRKWEKQTLFPAPVSSAEKMKGADAF